MDEARTNELPLLSKVALLATPYILGVAVLHLLGFWGPLGINPFDYVGLADLVPRALLPMTAVIFVFAFLFAAQELVLMKHFPVGGGSGSHTARFVRHHWNYSLSIFLLVIVSVVVILPEPWNWTVASWLIPLLSIPVAHLPATTRLLPNPTIRWTACFVLLALPVQAYSWGRWQAYHLPTSRDRLVLDLPRMQLPIRGDSTHPAVYLGKLGEYFMFYETYSGTVVVARSKDTDFVALMPRHKSATPNQ